VIKNGVLKHIVVIYFLFKFFKSVKIVIYSMLLALSRRASSATNYFIKVRSGFENLLKSTVFATTSLTH
jgi:hypothetical protein